MQKFVVLQNEQINFLRAEVVGAVFSLDLDLSQFFKRFHQRLGKHFGIGMGSTGGADCPKVEEVFPI